MMALAFLLVLGIYFGMAALLARFVFRFVRSHVSALGMGRFLGGSLAFAIVFGAVASVFWDAIPTWLTHRRLCETEAGLKVYMTPEQWAKANPEAFAKVREAAGRKPDRRFEDTRDVNHSWTESTLGFEYEYFDERKRDYAFQTGREIVRMTYKPTGQVLFEKVDFHSGAGRNSLANGASTLADYKFWTVTGNCERAHPGNPEIKEKFRYQGMSFDDLHKQIFDWNKK